MIADLDETIRQLLVAELPIKNGEVEVSFDQPKREWSSRLSRPTINFFLYDVRENVTLRQHQWEQVPNGNGGREARLKRTPFRVDCFYMLTTWAAEPDDEHRLLSRCLMALFRFPVFSEDRLVGSLKNPQFDIQARLAVHDRLTNPAEVWSSLDNEIRPSIPYIITLALDPWKEVTGPLVRTLTLRPGQSVTLPRSQVLSDEAREDEMVFIGGTVRGKGQTPAQGIEVGIKDTGLVSTTDVQGRFILGSMQPGEYILVARRGGEKPKEKKISVPSKDGGYDLEIE